jgi:UTP:GlnB (protein PII) uridylyltransferase
VFVTIGGVTSKGAAEPLATKHFVDTFVEEMPVDYRRRHDDFEIRLHADIVSRRGASLVHVERAVDHGPRGAEWLCFVTDDRPGLLSLLSAVLLAHALDVISAKVYCRKRRDGVDEAVDFFLVRPANGATGPIEDAKVKTIERAAESQLSGAIELEEFARDPRDTDRPEAPDTNVYFSRTSRDLLVVESQDRGGLLLTIALTLYRERVSIVRSEVTTFAGVARDEFVVAELDGNPLSGERRSAVVRALIAALDE